MDAGRPLGRFEDLLLSINRIYFIFICSTNKFGIQYGFLDILWPWHFKFNRPSKLNRVNKKVKVIKELIIIKLFFDALNHNDMDLLQSDFGLYDE